MVIQLRIDGAKLIFDPPFREVRDVILRLLTEIVKSAEDLPRVSCYLSRMEEYKNLKLTPTLYIFYIHHFLLVDFKQGRKTGEPGEKPSWPGNENNI